MIIIQHPIDVQLAYSFDNQYDRDRVIFFDIETTGLSADTSYLYLIGCVYHKASSFHLIQWFAEDINEECTLLAEFFHFLKDYDLLIHYNGNGFDIPYLMRKCNSLKLDYSFDEIESIDIYRRIAPYRRIWKLENIKQKTIEKFLNIRREDTFDGGELIEVYQSYLGKKRIEKLRKQRSPEETVSITLSDQLLSQLLLHNEDDLKGLVGISSMLSYCKLFENEPIVKQAILSQDNLTIEFLLSSQVPVPISFGNSVFVCKAMEHTGSLRVRTFPGELKYFYENYKDYYYLPEEDTAIHKSVASFVDSKHRIKSKASNCYIRKQGTFIPQFDMVIKPALKQTHKDRISYIDLSPEFLSDIDGLGRYVSHIINHLIADK